ncbi:fused D-ribose transporter subunits of ABC superfamily: ATP-binding components [Tepidanaerobacter acetatoxydans Re1]|uniref:Fused D-ribose transporter subunits of ABC superfamily: ATP-binding components n=1 Tax=Tepidanaerobacter acetatoxydans (strain DSM 21804 / JCM 16047 / Re1) TaxID=1209989 RepID=F4LR28_TEPAE|nr:sugar ABC transporter ATP-binding protein [Tepidanaerobacter acetatoxydans]AEE92181.1 Monosaccharide-transporting ATPase [Tepidanaerobacter acetatoxydans Re1]CDI40927.1 fused D-ribose transporter subunits of ABC superfamily: ATP-binding components [Tepidanaerobacter acetatoxydans Re1]
MPLLDENIVSIKNLTKDFPGVRALDDVSFDICKGEVHALVGENGAGKSTIIKILMGVYSRTSGEIFIDGESVDFKSPQQAEKYGLGAVYQDVNLAKDLTVAENFYMGHLPKNKLGLVDYKTMYKETEEILESINMHVNPRSIINELSVAQQEMIAIGKMLHIKAKLVIFDEPTALLTNEEIEELFKIIRLLKSRDAGIIYITHRLDEVFQISDRVTVLKDGMKVKTVNTDETNEDDLITMMVGRKTGDMYKINQAKHGTVVLKIENLSRDKVFRNINFEVRKGEIFGMFGLVGSGRTEIVKCIFGADKKDSGDIYINDQKVKVDNPEEAIKKGIALLPENRKDEGLALGLSISFNTNMVAIDKVSSHGVIDWVKSDKKAIELAERLKTKTPSIHQLVGNLSGGNQQKVVIAKWLAQESDIFIFDEPTVGIDVGAKQEIYKIFEQLVKQGKSIIVISSYLPEVMGLSDRILVMYEGEQMEILEKSDFDEEKILKLASGIK